MATVDKAKDLIEKLHKASWGPAIHGESDQFCSLGDIGLSK